jgi:hypothetical protein
MKITIGRPGTGQERRLPRTASPGSRSAGFQFHDTWEWDLSDYTHQFLWCCSAIPWAIARYDESGATEMTGAA